MMNAVRDDGPGRYALTNTEEGHVWGVCADVHGLFEQPPRGTYELFDWVPAGPEPRDWVGSRVWIVPEDSSADAWLLEDVVCLGRSPRGDGLVLTGLDEYYGPPEGHRAPARLHDEYRWLGSCREFARVLPAEAAPRSLVLRGLAPGDGLRRALANGTRRALDLGEAWLEIRDDRGELLTDRLLRPVVRSWGPSSRGTDLVDLELGGQLFQPVPEYARPVWGRWFAGPPDGLNAWAGLGSRERGVWLDLVRERGCRRRYETGPAGHTYEMDGRYVTDEPGLFLALGEAVNGPGGYFGGCLEALWDCLRGGFGCTAPATLVWRGADTAQERLSRRLSAEGEPWDLVAGVLDVLAAGGVRVTTVER
ncbi:barstar family protein [Streptomyces griseosporeus]|uniref:barstar family protein n=1 Tax=Streptomyces griseosporeus TaxID=1910 RepID=UPI0036A9C182